MAIGVFANGIEPANLDTEIWRFIGLDKFEKLLNGELYFGSADLFDDETEGLPPEEHEWVLNLSRYDLNDIQERNAAIGFIAQMRQSYYWLHDPSEGIGPYPFCRPVAVNVFHELDQTRRSVVAKKDTCGLAGQYECFLNRFGDPMVATDFLEEFAVLAKVHVKPVVHGFETERKRCINRLSAIAAREIYITLFGEFV